MVWETWGPCFGSLISLLLKVFYCLVVMHVIGTVVQSMRKSHTRRLALYIDRTDRNRPITRLPKRQSLVSMSGEEVVFFFKLLLFMSPSKLLPTGAAGNSDYWLWPKDQFTHCKKISPVATAMKLNLWVIGVKQVSPTVTVVVQSELCLWAYLVHLFSNSLW